MTEDKYFLSSLDSVRFEPVRECVIRRKLIFESGKVALQAEITPAVDGQEFGHPTGIHTVVLTSRHEDAPLDPIGQFPCFVFIAISTDPFTVDGRPLRAEDLEIIGWGELYRSQADALNHAFD